MRESKRALTTADVFGSIGDSIFGAGKSMKSDLSLLPVYASVRLLVDSLSTLPLHQHADGPDGSRKRVPLTPSLEWPGRPHPLPSAWLGQMVTSLALRGNAIGHVNGWDRTGLPERPTWLHPDKVRVEESGGKVQYFYDGKPLDGDRVVHLTNGMLIPGSVMGASPIEAARLAVEAGHEIQKFAKSWFVNRAIPSGIFKNSNKTLAPGEAEAISARFKAKIRGGEPLTVGSDWDYTALKVTADDAAFLTAIRATATQIATIFGVPPEKVGGDTGSSLTYSTVELNTIDFLTYSLRPWMERIEEAFSAWFCPPGQSVKFNADALIRVDTRTRYEIYKLRREIGHANTDELRALDDLAPLPDGQGQSYEPLKRVGTPKEGTNA